MNTKVYNYSTEYNNLINSLSTVKNILDDAKTELKKQRVSIPLNYESLKEGNFVEIFLNYHKQELQNDPAKPTFEKYLDYRGLTDVSLQKLENTYKGWLNFKKDFYKYNNAFYFFCEYRKQDPKYGNLLSKAPAKKTYCLFDFITIKKDNFKIQVPEDPFNVYVNNTQLKFIDNVKKFVEVSKSLNLDYKYIKAPIEPYLLKSDMYNTNQVGLSRDLNEINFDYSNILTIE
ncbi:hypothetical protein [Wenyingzhuangia sp. 2_MG-2023]|uniref:hypothetical protein n=1 Tax=Wenyingzhuangia sp. 2_MG-2023 TaxID=3062639 RepID=UPI0026E21E7C|nr:hypothetical protein [Wenyingzhuangia sp. 2_MG-2023]MDO6736499.1 hypothetical protein [Wenyingzhuangia sp. 2_MG-2023]